jgi:hypothetical protein
VVQVAVGQFQHGLVGPKSKNTFKIIEQDTFFSQEKQ